MGKELGIVACIVFGVLIFFFVFFTMFTELDQIKDRWGCEGHQEILFVQTKFVKYDGCYVVHEGAYKRIRHIF